MYPLPPNTSYTVLSSSAFNDLEDGYTDNSNSVLYQAPSGAWVFNAGSIAWSWALDRSGFVDPGIQQMTSNILDGFTGAKATPAVQSSIPPCTEHDLMSFESGSLTSSTDGAQRAL